MNKAENTHAFCISEILLGLFLSVSNICSIKILGGREYKIQKISVISKI